MEKRYKIKEEARKYIGKELHDRKLMMHTWESNYNLTLEALEEVEERIKVVIDINSSDALIKIGSGFNQNWTEKERELIEFVLNEFGNLTGLDLAANSFALMCNKKEEFPLFTGWLKQRKH